MQVDEGPHAAESEVSTDKAAMQQESGAAMRLTEDEEADASSTQEGAVSSEHGMEKNYTDTIETLLSELWKERLVSICALHVIAACLMRGFRVMASSCSSDQQVASIAS